MITQDQFIRERKRLRSALTLWSRTKANSNTPPDVAAAIAASHRLENVAAAGLALFEEVGYPDSWHEWRVALDDAEYALRRLGSGGAFPSGRNLGGWS